MEAAIGLHRDLGPGLLEIVYEVTMARELTDLLNFGEATLKDGITRCVNGLEGKIIGAPKSAPVASAPLTMNSRRERERGGFFMFLIAMNRIRAGRPWK